jgi:chitinase
MSCLLVVVTVLPIWPVTIPSNVSNTTIYPMMRIPPQTVVITDDPNPLSQSGVTHPVVTRSVLFPLTPGTLLGQRTMISSR